jgi:hypothetical protein
MRKLCLVFFLCAPFILLGGDCDLPEKLPVQKKIAAEKKPSKRFTLESFGSFDAGYSLNTREILIITDTETKKKYLAITGCGVTEMVDEGKTQAEE